MCKAEFTDEHDIKWDWYKCGHFCNNCQICFKGSDENHKTHTLEEIEMIEPLLDNDPPGDHTCQDPCM